MVRTVTLTAKLANSLFGGVLNGVLIYDASSVPGNKTAVDTSGGSAASYFGGAMYFPHVDVTWGGNAASRLNCTEIVAYTFTLSGTAALDESGCSANGISKVTNQVVLLTK